MYNPNHNPYTFDEINPGAILSSVHCYVGIPAPIHDARAPSLAGRWLRHSSSAFGRPDIGDFEKGK